MNLRNAIFEWISDTFCGLGVNGLINYTEKVNEQVERPGTGSERIWVVTEIIFAVGLKDAEERLCRKKTHEVWKEEFEGLVKPGGKDVLKITAEITVVNTTPDVVEMARGIDPKTLVSRHSFLLRVSIVQRRLLGE